MAMKSILFRFPEELIARLDQHVARELAKKPGYKITRSDVVRNLLEVMLRQEAPGSPDGSIEPTEDDDDAPLTEADRKYWGLSPSKDSPSTTKRKKEPSRARRSRVKK